MSDLFDPSQGPILVVTEITGPDRRVAVQLNLDIGATNSLLNEAMV
jgi:hypothetical protein